MLHRELQTLATAIMFLTRIPVGSHASASPQVLARSTLYFPIVGLVVGLLTAVSFLLANAIWPTIIATAIALLFSIALTGAFHEDGLADVADSLGAWTKERKLEVMRDSRIGTYGAVALILVILLKYITLFTIFNSTFTDTDNAVITSPALVLATFSLAHVLGRWSSLPDRKSVV